MQYRPTSITLALYLNAALLATIAFALLARSGNTPTLDLASPAFAQNVPLAGGAGLYVTPGQFSRDTFGCYLLDTDGQSLCVYQWDPTDRKLRLRAARSFRYDRRLQNFNTENPTPLEVKDLLEKEAATLRPRAGATQPNE